ncbi:MAG: CoA transferase, partial [Chloroflexi bacterium]|nr:CoA transferase [Chloroflexota bacterium]
DVPDLNRSLYFWHYNTNKRSITLNLETESGRAIFRRLAGDADVVVESLPPGTMARWGLDYDALSDLNPGLVMVGISPFGQSGPYSDWQATDLTVLAMAGPAWSCGYDDHSIPPVRGGGNQGYQTGCHQAFMGALVALLVRDVTGEGQYVDANLHASSNITTEAGSYQWLVAGATVQRQTGRHAGTVASPPSQVLCADGRYVNAGFAPRTEEEYFNLINWLNEEGVLDDINRYLEPINRLALQAGDPNARAQMNGVLEAISRLGLKKNAYDLFVEAQNKGFQWGVIYSPEEMLNDRHFRERGFVVQVEHPELGLSFEYPGAPYKFMESPWRIVRRAPLLGEDNLAVYEGELGFTREQLSALSEGGVI